MSKLTVPKKYLVEGLEAVGYSNPDDKCEAVSYITPKGTKFVIAKDFMGVHICKSGIFWPAEYTAFNSLEAAVEILRKSTPFAIAFFDEVQAEREAEHEG